jgi:hypothetical protein
MVGRVHIEPDDVANLAHEQRVTRELERLAAVRLRGKSMPDAHNCRLAQPDRLRQAARSRPCGFSTKLHLRAEGNGRPVTVVLTGGERNEQIALETVLDQVLSAFAPKVTA